jgi:single-strand DNA-binding protein
MSVNFSDVGRIGKDAVTRHTGNGEPVTGFSVAIDSGFGDKKVTIWLDCSAWGKRYEGVAPYLVKGSQVFVQGEIGTREHDGKTYITLRVADLKLVGGKQTGESQAPRQDRASTQQPAPHRDASYGDVDDSDIPFLQFRRKSYC